MKFEIIEKLENSSISSKDLWINEAFFGLDHISQYLEKINDKATILEIGCGSGILLSMLCEKFKHLDFDGIEPFGEGFGHLENINKFIISQGIHITNTMYEEYNTEKKYDFIFCINVFEHLKDWKHFLTKLSDLLKHDGICVILCPNYAIPYESHFKIPIIFNKKTTYYFFQRFINKFEAENKCPGLWDSLNFVTKKNVKKFVNKNRKLTLTDINSITRELISRADSDTEFKKRQKIMSMIGKLFINLQLIRFFDLFPNYSPYMKLVLKKDLTN